MISYRVWVSQMQGRDMKHGLSNQVAARKLGEYAFDNRYTSEGSRSLMTSIDILLCQGIFAVDRSRALESNLMPKKAAAKLITNHNNERHEQFVNI